MTAPRTTRPTDAADRAQPILMPSPRSAPLDAALAPDVAQRLAIDPDTAWFLDFLFGEQDGWLCLGYVDGDPSIPKGQPGYTPLKEEWYRWPRQRPEVLQRFVEHDTRDHNIYVRQCLFTKQGGSQANALDSRIVWQDDVTDANKPCSVLIQTSERKYQALLLLDRSATIAERKRLAVEWHTASADTEDIQHASYDPAHHIRVPGGHNSKSHGWYTVHYAMRSERSYSADRLLARCRGGNTPLSGAVSAARAEQHDVANWKQLPDGRRLLDSPRWQAIINGRPQLRIQLIERQRMTITNKNGTLDDSDSVQRAVFVQNLITSWSEKSPGHLPECEIRAAALTLKTLLGSGMAMEAYQVDIDCLINSYRPQVYRPVATRRLAAKRKRGRPAGGLGAQTKQLLDIILAIEPDDMGRHCYTLAALSEQTKAPRRTVQYRIKRLRDTGHLVTGQVDGNGVSYALPGKSVGGAQVNSLSVKPSITAAEPPETPFDATPHGETGYKREGVYPPDRAREFALPAGQPGDKEKRSDQHVDRLDEADQPGGCGERTGSRAVVFSAPTAPLDCEQRDDRAHADEDDADRRHGDETTESATLAPALADLAAHYLSMPATAIGERFVNKKTGTVVYRRTARHFAALVVEHYGDAYTRADAIAAYTAERARLAELVRQEWERFFRRLKAMSDDELIAYIAGRCRTEVAELAREGAIFDKHLYRTRLKCAKQHLEWRRLKMPDPKPGRRSLAPGRSPRSQTPAPAVASLQLDSSPQHRALM
jgi:hypothetical protein